MIPVTPISSIAVSHPWGTAIPSGLPGIFLAGLLLCLVAMFWPGSVRGKGGDRVREPILAGSWYPAPSAELAESVATYLEGNGRPEVPRPAGFAEAESLASRGHNPRAVIVPHAGYIYSGPCAGETFRLLRNSGVRRVILLGPSHRYGFRGAALPEEAFFATPLGRIPLDEDAIGRLRQVPGFEVLDRAHAQEHSLEIELPFLQEVLRPGFRLVPVVIGQLDDASVANLAQAIRNLWDEETVVVVSSDFTHYGAAFDYRPFFDRLPERLRQLDLGAVSRIESLDGEAFEAYLDSTGATICGAAPIRILLAAAREMSLRPLLIDYYRSGDLTGDWDHSVSYAGVALFPEEAGVGRSGAGLPRTGVLPSAPTPETPNASSMESPDSSPHAGTTTAGPDDSAGTDPAAGPRLLNETERDYLLSLARATVRAVVLEQPLPPAEPPASIGPDSPLREDRGVFVTLTEGPRNRLRGCIGNILGNEPLAAGVVQNAEASASRDPRFPPVAKAELDDLHIEISVLTPPVLVPGWEAIRAGIDGVVLEKGSRRAVFLPQVATEMHWDVPEMLRNLSLKAGLGPEDWRQEARFYTFQAQIFEEASPRGR